MTVLLKDALKPNLVQTLENNPAFIHGGPFANIAHGCNSVIATQTRAQARRLRGDRGGLRRRPRRREVHRHQVPQVGPAARRAVVIVATIRALKYHGGVDVKELNKENLAALEKGIVNLERHVDNVRKHLRPALRGRRSTTSPSDTDAEIELLQRRDGAARRARWCSRTHWADGGKGAAELAQEVVAPVRAAQRASTSSTRTTTRSGTR